MRILMVEDDVKIASFVIKGLQQSSFSVDHVTDGESALDFCAMNTYDAMIVDVLLDNMDGLTFIEKVREQRIKTPILILSAKRSVDDRVLGLQKGGDDYLTKPFSFSELLARLQALIRRSSMIESTRPTKLEIADISLDLLTREVVRGGQQIDLQTKEFTVLVYLMQNAGNVLSKTMIMEHVWNYDFDPQTNVVDVLIHRLRTKIDKDFDIKLIHTIRGVGYVLRAPHEGPKTSKF